MSLPKAAKSITRNAADSQLSKSLPSNSLFLHRCFMSFCEFFFRYYCPLTIIGRDRLPLEPFIFCSNHSSHMDSAVLMTASGFPFPQCAMVAAKDYFFEHRRHGVVKKLMNLIPIDREASRQSMILNVQLCQAFLAQGNQNIIIYPEGTRSVDGKLGIFKKGSAWLAMRLNMPIVPVYINGTYASLPKGSFLPRPCRITATIGKPIYPQQFLKQSGQSRPNSQSYQQLTEALKTIIAQLEEQTIGT